MSALTAQSAEESSAGVDYEEELASILSGERDAGGGWASDRPAPSYAADEPRDVPRAKAAEVPQTLLDKYLKRSHPKSGGGRKSSKRKPKKRRSDGRRTLLKRRSVVRRTLLKRRKKRTHRRR